MPRRYEFAPGLALSVGGSGAVFRHFDAEYAAAAEPAAAGSADVQIQFGAPASNCPRGVLRGGHKSVRWHVDLASPESEWLRASIQLAGRPRSFALSLVQGYVVEPLISVAAARRGLVLLPAAAFSEDGGAVIVMGRSRSGKSSLAFLALSSGRMLLGDDQVLLEAPRGCRPFPRRLRLYPDVRRTAPAAHAALSSRRRRGLQLRWAADALSRGYVRPPIRVEATEVGLAARSPLAIGRVVLIERGGSGRELSVAPLERGAVVEAGIALLAEQRAKLRTVADERWSGALAAAAEAEEVTLHQVFQGVPAERVALPAAWDAAQAVGALAEHFRLGIA